MGITGRSGGDNSKGRFSVVARIARKAFRPRKKNLLRKQLECKTRAVVRKQPTTKKNQKNKNPHPQKHPPQKQKKQNPQNNQKHQEQKKKKKPHPPPTKTHTTTNNPTRKSSWGGVCQQWSDMRSKRSASEAGKAASQWGYKKV